MIQETNCIKAAAIRYAELGYKVFPCIPRDKKPIVKEWQLKATNDYYKIDDWWTEWPNANIGLSTEDLIVVDVDVVDKLPNPFLKDKNLSGCVSIQGTPRGGYHFIYRQPANSQFHNTTGKIAQGIDTRANGGYIVVAPSQVDGNKYRFYPKHELVTMQNLTEPPGFILNALQANQKPQDKPVNKDGEIIGEGMRNATLTSLAGSMRWRGMTENEIRLSLLTINENRVRPMLDEAEIEKIVKSIGNKEPGNFKVNGDLKCTGESRPDFVFMSDVEAETVDWLWQDRFPLGKVSMISGDPDLGKTFTALSVATYLSNGWPLPGEDGNYRQPAGSVILTAEDGLGDTIKPRLIAMKADCNRIAVLKGTIIETSKGSTHKEFDLRTDIKNLSKMIDLVENCKLVVIDPISSYLGGVDCNKNAEVRAALRPLVDLADKKRVAVILINHLNKNGGSNAKYRSIGSIAFLGLARSCWSVVQNRENKSRCFMLPVKNNLSEVKENGLCYEIKNNALIWGDDVAMGAQDYVNEETKPGPDPEARNEAKVFLMDILKAGPVPAKEVYTEANEAGITRSTLNRSKQDLKIKPFKSKVRGGWLWQLPAFIEGGPND